MSPKVKPKSARAFREERDARLALYEGHADEMLKLERSEVTALDDELPTDALLKAKRTLQLVRERPVYGPNSEHSWVLDSALALMPVADPSARDRLTRHREATRGEQRAIGTATLGGLVPATIPPYVAEAVAYGVRSGAPLAVALERLDLPPVGVDVACASVQQCHMIERITIASLRVRSGRAQHPGGPRSDSTVATSY